MLVVCVALATGKPGRRCGQQTGMVATFIMSPIDINSNSLSDAFCLSTVLAVCSISPAFCSFSSCLSYSLMAAVNSLSSQRRSHPIQLCNAISRYSFCTYLLWLLLLSRMARITRNIHNDARLSFWF